MSNEVQVGLLAQKLGYKLRRSDGYEGAEYFILRGKSTFVALENPVAGGFTLGEAKAWLTAALKRS